LSLFRRYKYFRLIRLFMPDCHRSFGGHAECRHVFDFSVVVNSLDLPREFQCYLL